MRHVHLWMASPVLALSGIAVWASGCGTFADECITSPGPSCEKSFISGSGGSTSSTSVSSSMTTASGMMSTTSTGMNPGCKGTPANILIPATIGSFVTDDCGVFVAADAVDASGDGTKEKPFKTLEAAIAGAKGKAIFVCATTPFAEKLDITESVAMYGGFDCAKDWSWDSAVRSHITGNADEIPVTIEKSAKSVTLWNMGVQAADAMTDSGSSIAMAIAEMVDVTLTRCDVSAGAGNKGLAGLSQTGSAAAGTNAALKGGAACVQSYSALPGTTTCGGTKTDGGFGGPGGDVSSDGGKGQSGKDGSPAPSGPEGKGGTGEGQVGASPCSPGSNGKNGTAGNPGAAGTTADTVLSLTGVSGGNGGDGKPGVPGGGGGGGGGARAGNFCGATADMATFGPGGGGGGAGGCGGIGGGGGKSGGSSVAILSLGTQLSLTEVTLTTSAGGSGGVGGTAQMGGDSGLGAKGGDKIKGGFNDGCAGGDGGTGGKGGNGGGARGGHSIGIAFASTPSAKLMLKFTGGAPGAGGDANNKGIGGATAACWDFMTNTSCAQ